MERVLGIGHIFQLLPRKHTKHVYYTVTVTGNLCETLEHFRGTPHADRLAPGLDGSVSEYKLTLPVLSTLRLRHFCLEQTLTNGSQDTSTSLLWMALLQSESLALKCISKCKSCAGISTCFVLRVTQSIRGLHMLVNQVWF